MFSFRTLSEIKGIWRWLEDSRISWQVDRIFQTIMGTSRSSGSNGQDERIGKTVDVWVDLAPEARDHDIPVDSNWTSCRDVEEKEVRDSIQQSWGTNIYLGVTISCVWIKNWKRSTLALKNMKFPSVYLNIKKKLVSYYRLYVPRLMTTSPGG